MEQNCCRLCLKIELNIMINIFSEYGMLHNIPNILAQHFWFEVKEDDNYSNKICQNCWKHVESFHLFYTRVSILYSELREFVKTETISSAAYHTRSSEPDSGHVIINELKVSLLSGCDKGKLVISDLENYGRGTSKLSDSGENDCKKLNSESSRRILSTSNKLLSLDSKREKSTEELAMIKKEDQELREHFKMGCDLCSFQFHVFQNVKTHYRVAHQLNGYLTCCEKKFFKRWHALEHIRRHLNPDAFKCNICDKIYIDKRGLQTHMYQHLPSEEKQFKCQKCPKSFAKNSLLRQHQIRHVTEEEKTFFCDECGKAFASNCLLQFHKRGVHQGAFIHVCEICAKSFKSKLFFENHMKAIHSGVVLPKIQCQTCGAWLKHEHSLKSHMRRHDDAKKTYICNVCGKQAPNRGALQSHKKYTHLIARCHKCTICEKAFKKSVTLREHMTLHTGEILYKCPHCPKTFNSSANLHSHRKKVHTTEWEQTRRTKIINYNENGSTYL